ncbi:MAG: non-homologous end-joining DNA ligase [Acidimicrobiia bacterium]|nr:non-homologous end-joining DNA ligase [Acidimicrobiia bacterium]
MKATSGQLPTGDDWVFEPKWDGHRALVRTGATPTVASSTGRDRTGAWPWLAEALAGRCPPGVVLDAEVIALDDDGRHRFSLVGDAAAPHALVVFDVLATGDEVVTAEPWRDRRRRLEALVEPGPQLVVTSVTDDGSALWAVTAEQRYEGVVAKRADSAYLPGRRSPSWVKSKHRATQEFVVGGWLEGTGRRADGLGSLLLGVHDDEGVLRYAGSAGSGLTDRSRAEWQALLEPLAASEAPFAPPPRVDRRRVRWARPELVAQVAFAEWTDDGRLRHPVVEGRRHDVDPTAVQREPAPADPTSPSS